MQVAGNVVSVPGKSAGQTLVEAVKTHHAFCVVMGSRGLGRVKRVLLGSVSDHVMHHADGPVIVVRPTHHNDDGGGDKVKDKDHSKRYH